MTAEASMSSSSDYRKDIALPTARQRSLFTANSYSQGEENQSAPHHADEPSTSTKSFDSSTNSENPEESADGAGPSTSSAASPAPETASPSTSVTTTTSTTTSSSSSQPLWRTAAARAGKCPTGLYPGDDLYPKETSWRDPISEVALESNPPPLGIPNAPSSMGMTGGASATPHGTISVRLRERIRVDLTIDKAIRVINFKNNIVLSLAGTGSAAALMHPNGRVYQYGSRVEILAHDIHNNNKYAKMWYKGVSFTSDQCALVYLVDAAGTRTTTDSFTDMSQDFSLSVFYNESRHGPQHFQEAVSILHASQYWYTDDGIDNYVINNVRISQTPDGLVRIARNSNKCMIRTSPANGSATLTTPFMHCTASMGHTSHLFVRRGERRMHFDGASFIVRNAGHSAGFDEKNMLKVY